MFDWIANNRDLFLVNYTEIGNSHQMAVELNSEHTQFANSAVVCICYLLWHHRMICYRCYYVTIGDYVVPIEMQVELLVIDDSFIFLLISLIIKNPINENINSFLKDPNQLYWLQ